MYFYLPHPVTYIVEALLRGAIIGKDYAHCPFVVSLGDCSKSFLTSSIPYLQFDIFSVDIDCFDLKVDSYIKAMKLGNDTYGGDVGNGKSVISKTEEETCLPNP